MQRWQWLVTGNRRTTTWPYRPATSYAFRLESSVMGQSHPKAFATRLRPTSNGDGISTHFHTAGFYSKSTHVHSCDLTTFRTYRHMFNVHAFTVVRQISILTWYCYIVLVSCSRPGQTTVFVGWAPGVPDDHDVIWMENIQSSEHVHVYQYVHVTYHVSVVSLYYLHVLRMTLHVYGLW